MRTIFVDTVREVQNAPIPNSAAWMTDQERSAVEACLKSGQIGSIEEKMKPVKEALKHFTHGHEVLLTTSCTTAMELALFALELKPGDEVIVPSFTFVSTATAVLQAGGKPVFVDSDPETLNIDPDCIKKAITSRTRAIMPVHYAGVACDMDRIDAIAKEHDLVVIEDAAHGIGAKYKNRFLGTLGTFGCFSFHDTKNCTCGEGGAIVINDPAYKEKVEIMYEKGTNRSAFLRGEVDKYTWISRGSSYPLSAILGEVLRVQLGRLSDMNAMRGHIVERYQSELATLKDEGLIRFQTIPDYAETNHHIACFLVNDRSTRNDLLRFMRDRGIGALFHYLPLHRSPYATKHLGSKETDCPVADEIADSIVRLPLFPHMKEEQVDRVIDGVFEFFQKKTHRSDVPRVSQEQENGTTYDFSLVVACYNEAPHLKQNLDEVLSILDRTNISYEVIIIDDKSPDETADLIREYVASHPHHNIRAVYHQENKGRGATVTEGMLMAKGRYTGFIDIDLEIPARYIPGALLPLQSGKADMVLAERNYKFQPLSVHRYVMSVGYRWLTQKMLGISGLDTEAGFKFFRRDAIVPLLKRTQDARWFWDTEITVNALDDGLRIHIEPVLFDRKREKKSTVRFVPDSIRSFRKLLAYKKERRKRS